MVPSMRYVPIDTPDDDGPLRIDVARIVRDLGIELATVRCTNCGAEFPAWMPPGGEFAGGGHVCPGGGSGAWRRA